MFWLITTLIAQVKDVKYAKTESLSKTDWGLTMKERNPEYIQNNRKGNKVATVCRVCGNKLYLPEEIKKEVHDRCNKDNTKIYMM